MASGSSLTDLSAEEAKTEAKRLRNEGNTYFKTNQYEKAIEKSKKSVEISRENGLKEEEVKALCNISLSYLKLEQNESALEYADRAVTVDQTCAKAYYRRAQAKEVLGVPECVKDYCTSCRLQPLLSTLYCVVKTAVDHGCTIMGIPTTAKHLKYIKRNMELDKLYMKSVTNQKFGIIPLLAFVLKEEVSCHEIVEAISASPIVKQDGVHEMVASIHSHSEYLKSKIGEVSECQIEEMLRATVKMKTQLIRETIIQDELKIAELFLDRFELEGCVIDIAELLQTTALCYNPHLLHKMFVKGANLDNCDVNPIKVALSRDFTSPVTKLHLISILVKNGANVNLHLDGTTIIHEVVQTILSCGDDGNVDTLKSVCKDFDFDRRAVLDEAGQTPWHLALGAKRSRISKEICQILCDYPIDPCLEDKAGKRADSGKKDKDERVVLLRKKEAEIREKMEMKEVPKERKSRRRKKRKKPSPREMTCASAPEDKQQNESSDNGAIQDAKVDDKNENASSEENTPVVVEDDTQKKTPDEINKVLKHQLERVHCHEDEYFHLAPEKKPKSLYAVNKTTQSGKSSKTDPPVHEEEGEQMRNDEQKPAKQSQPKDAEEKLDFDNQPWEIECAEKVMKVLSGRKHSDIKRFFMEKVMMLAAGEFYGKQKLCKSVSKNIPELYETQLKGEYRIIWEIAVQFSPRCTNKKDTSERNYIFSEVIRVWDVVFDHDKIHHCVENIERNVYNRGRQASHLVKLNMKSENPTTKCVTGNMRYPRTFQCDNPDMEPDISLDKEYIPPIHPEQNQYTIAPLFELTTSMVKHMLEGRDVEKAFPYKEWPREHDIINMSGKEPILLLGRSGTGKTTCCLYRLWNEFKKYWSVHEGLEYSLIPKCFPRQSVQEKETEKVEEACQPDKARSTSCETEREEECKREVVESNVPTEDQDQPTSKVSAENNTTYDHLHQVFITKNYVLCNRLRKQFYKFASAEECAKHHMQSKDEELPHNLADIDNLAYPLFLTARQFYILLDYSLHDDRFFFERDEEGKMVEKIHSSDYDHEDADTCYLDDSDDEDGIFHQLYPTQVRQKLKKERREVTASYFKEKIWPLLQNKPANMSAIMAWMEIKTFIKGSREAIESKKGYLSEDEYIKLGKRRAPNFPGNRHEVYCLFQEYIHYIQNHPLECLFDECHLIHSLFQRLKEQRSVPWTFHSIYIDEVQDFTQGELWLILQTCQDKNGFFLTGDTAQSIMSGISFRFEDVKTLFHCMKERLDTTRRGKIVVPKVHHLVINFRSHSGILRLAASITDVLKEFFPHSFDHQDLPRDEGLVSGPIPLLFHSCSASDLAMVLAGNKRTQSSIDFGAHQAIIVRNQKAKDELPDDLSSAIVLTIFESKGLEFDDVLLYNFFTDSEVSEEWRTLTSYCDKQPQVHSAATDEVKSKLSDSVYPKPHPLEFDEMKHKQLNSELKHLYTAITRTKSKLWLYESGQKHQPAVYYWQDCHQLVKVVPREELTKNSDEIFASASTLEDWKIRGDEFLHDKFWHVARKCYERAKCPQKVQECEAFMCFQKARKVQNKAEKQTAYLSAAIAFLESDEIQHNSRALVGAARCLFNGKKYEEAARLYMRLEKFSDALKSYFTAKMFDRCVEVMESQLMYKEAVLLSFRHDTLEAVALASKYIRQRHVNIHDVDQKVIRHGRRLIERFSQSGDKIKLLTVIDCIPPTLQVRLLKEVRAYNEATAVLQSIGKHEEAYALMLAQGMYRAAFELAKQLADMSKKYETILLATKSHLSCHLSKHNIDSEIPGLQEELTTLCESEDVDLAIKAMALLLLSKLNQNEKTCQEAIQLFQHQHNRVGECEAFFVLSSMPSLKKDLKYIEQAVKVCREANNICTIVMTTPPQRTASFTKILQQIEDFYGFKKVKNEYIFYLHQNVWIELAHSVAEHPQKKETEAISLKLQAVYDLVYSHLQLTIVRLMDNDETRKPILNALEPFKFHNKTIERSHGYSRKKITEYVTAYCMGLEQMVYLPRNNITSEFQTLQKSFLDFFKVNSLLFLGLDENHFHLICSIPSAVHILTERIQTILNMHTQALRVDDWMEVWTLLHVLKRNDNQLNREIRARASSTIFDADRHFFFIDNFSGQYVHHFHRWVRGCLCLRNGKQALIAIGILIKFIEVIARRKSLKISDLNMVYIMGVSAMILYTFIALSEHEATVVIPQIVTDMMRSFDKVNCQEKGDKPTFQSCLETLNFLKNKETVSHTAIDGIQRILRVLIGTYRGNFNILRRAAINQQGTSVIPTIILALTLLGNMSLMNRFKPFDMLDHQRKIRFALEPIMKRPDSQVELKDTCDRFAECTSSRAVFTLVQKLHQLYSGTIHTHDGIASDISVIQVTRGRIQLKPTYLHRIPQNSLLPLRIKKPDSTAVVTPASDEHCAASKATGLTDTATKDDTPPDQYLDSGGDKWRESLKGVPEIEEQPEGEVQLEKRNHSDSEELNETRGSFTRLESQISEENAYDEEIEEALALEESDEEVTQEPEVLAGVDTSVIDNEFCHVCGITLLSNASKSTSLKEHMAGEEHKQKKQEYESFQVAKPLLAAGKDRWEDEIRKWKSPENSSDLEVIIHDIKEQIKKLEDTLHDTEKNRKWKEGEAKLQETDNSIQTLLHKGRQECTKGTQQEAEEHASPATKENVVDHLEQEEEEQELSDFDEDPDTTSRQMKRRERRRRKK